jgi:hypothetical protein
VRAMSNPPGHVHAPHPAVGFHHLVLCFLPDGTVNFYPSTEDPPELARRFADIIRVLLEHPTAIRCAAHPPRTEPPL